MNRRFQNLLLRILVFLFLSVQVNAANYIDQMRTIEPDGIRTLSGLRAAERAGLPDTDYLTFQNPLSQNGAVFGSVTYQVSGAEEITVAIYTQKGSFYLYNNQDYDDLSGYMMGIVNAGRMPQWDNSRPQMGTASDGRYYLFADIAGARHRLYQYRTDSMLSGPHIFLPEDTDAKAPTNLRPYAVAVWSSDGTTEKAVAMERIGLEYIPAQNYCYELFRGTVSQPGVTKIRVEINDFTSLPHSDHSGYISKVATIQTGLASVRLSGGTLLLGPQEAVRTPEEDPDGDESSSSKESRKDSRQSLSDRVEYSNEPSGESSSPSSVEAKSQVSPKFEGDITASSQGDSDGASSSKENSTETKPKMTKETEPPFEVEPLAGSIVYEKPASPEKQDAFAIVILAYIILTASVLVFVIVRSIKK